MQILSTAIVSSRGAGSGPSGQENNRSEKGASLDEPFLSRNISYVSGMRVVMIDGSHFQSSSRRCCVMQGREWFKPLKQACGPALKKPKFKRKSKEKDGKILSLTHCAVGFDIAVRSCMDGCWF